MAATEVVDSEEMVDTAIGPVRVVQSTVTGLDVDDFVSTTVDSLAIAIRMFNTASRVNTQDAEDRRIVSVGGVTVGGY